MGKTFKEPKKPKQTTKHRKIPKVSPAKDCAQYNPKSNTCEGTTNKSCIDCTFWISEEEYDWDKINKCPKSIDW